MVFSAVEWLHGLMNVIKTDLMKAVSTIEWNNLHCRCIVIYIVDALLFALWNSEINFYLQV